MPQIMIQCRNCQHLFNSGIFLGTGSSNITLTSNKSQCPNCGSMENIPDGTFTATVNGFVDVLKGSNNPLQEALNIYNRLKKARDLDDLSNIPSGDKIEKILKDNKLKILVGMAIIKVIIDLLTNKPDTQINNTIINQQFYTQYNQVIDIETEK